MSTPDASAPARLAYADPPYPGLAARYYADHPDYDGEVDHDELLERLATFDGWALSTSAAALPDVLASCLAGETRRVRVAAWVRGGRHNAVSHAPVATWEPVIYVPARSTRRSSTSDGSPPEDSLVFTSRPRTTDPARVIGAKPATFCRWVFELMAAAPGDDLVDLFPGSGGVARAWSIWSDDASPGPSATRRAVPESTATHPDVERDASCVDPTTRSVEQLDGRSA